MKAKTKKGIIREALLLQNSRNEKVKNKKGKPNLAFREFHWIKIGKINTAKYLAYLEASEANKGIPLWKLYFMFVPWDNWNNPRPKETIK